MAGELVTFFKVSAPGRGDTHYVVAGKIDNVFKGIKHVGMRSGFATVKGAESLLRSLERLKPDYEMCILKVAARGRQIEHVPGASRYYPPYKDQGSW